MLLLCLPPAAPLLSYSQFSQSHFSSSQLFSPLSAAPSYCAPLPPSRPVEKGISSTMDVSHIAEMEDGLNDDEMEASFEGDADAGTNDQIATEDHAADTPIASDEHAMVQQQVGLKKKSMYVNDHRVVKQRKLAPTVAAPAMNKDKGPVSISKPKTKKPTGTPTTKLMASAFKVTSSKDKLMVLMQKPVEVVQPAIASASAIANAIASSSVRASASASITPSAQASVEDDEKQTDG